ncbi:unnamed protein product [Brassicogethes aeneus]|uniref:Uncharacterized protein n=1 Tax=Brassicogethes aeneus TaxID=1431903 RepID=A0A9P0FAP2_BRAAE|nr:unnamed protein product [Brassicogethes aeneus]
MISQSTTGLQLSKTLIDNNEEIGVNVNVFDSTKKSRINGSVSIVSTRPLKYKQLILEVNNTSECKFELEKSMYVFPRIYAKGTVMESRQQFFFLRRVVEKVDYYCNDPKNSAVFNFNFGWPNRLPATWTGDHGNIKYLCKTILVCEDITHVHVQEIYFAPNRKLCLEKQLLCESRQDVTRKFTFGKNGRISVSFWIPISGIAVGQSLPAVCSINNESKLNFSGLVFVLTRIDVYRSDKPINVVKEVRTDVCRVARMVHILKGKFYFYAILKTDENVSPTNQFYKLDAIQVKYEVWVSVQGNFKKNMGYGHPNVDTPGMAVIIGSEPLINYNVDLVTKSVLKNIFYTPPLKNFPQQHVISEALTTVDEVIDEQTNINLLRQLEENEKAITEMIEDTSDDDEVLNFFS